MTATLDIQQPSALAAASRRRYVTARSLSEIAELEAQWDACPSAAANPMSSFSWLQSATASLAQRQRVQVVALFDGDRLRAAAPLIQGPAGRWELLNHYKLYEPADLLFADETSLEQLADELARRGLPLFLGRVPAVSPTFAAIERAYGRRGLMARRPQA
ncbi:MAG TPA: hypothetical protein VGX76_21990, partial [Pirellulales bacterium]|nr:hypothetical protein [Pirellulales bacterium]